MRLLCSTLGVHPSGYYAWLKSPLSQRAKADRQLTTHIKQHWIESGGYSGYRNIHKDLLEAGNVCGRDRLLRLMCQAGLRAQRGYNSLKAITGAACL